MTRHRHLILSTVLALGLAGAGSAAAAVVTRTVTVTGGTTHATLTYTAQKARASDPVNTTAMRLEVTRDDGAAATFTNAQLKFQFPVIIDPSTALQVRDLDGDGVPEVVLDSFTGGAHCCFDTRVAWFSTEANAFQLRALSWGDVPPTLKDLDKNGIPEFAGFDDRFAYAFGDAYVASVFPPEIWNFRAGQLVDTSRQFPAYFAKQLPEYWRTYLRARHFGAPADALAAYIATAAVAGHKQAAVRRATLAEGHRNPRMLRTILRTLVKWGYR